MTTPKIIRPQGDGWNDALGPGLEQSLAPQATSSQLETTVTAEQQPTGPAKPNYPRKLLLDLDEYLREIFKGFKNLPSIPGSQGQDQYDAHAALFLSLFGIEGITIVHGSHRTFSTDDTDTRQEYAIKSDITFKPTASQIRAYITSLFGEEVLKDPKASDFSEFPPEATIELLNLPILIPNLPSQFEFVERIKYDHHGRFYSPYAAVMSITPEHGTRLAVARAMLSGFAEGSIRFQSAPENFIKDQDKPYPSTFAFADEKNITSQERLRAEATKLGVADPDKCVGAYIRSIEHQNKQLRPW